MDKAPPLRLETLVDFLLLVLGVVIVVISFGYGFGSLAAPGPGLYPVFLGLCIALFSFFILIADLKAQAAALVLERSRVKTILLMLLAFSFWIIAMDWLGYVVATLLVTYAICKIMKLEGWKKPLAVATGTAAFLYLLFDYWLYIDLPRGIFE
jgi:hypothetical protein